MVCGGGVRLVFVVSHSSLSSLSLITPHVLVFVILSMYICVYTRVKREEHWCWDPKGGERSLRRATSGETLVESPGDITCKPFKILWQRETKTKDRSNHQIAAKAGAEQLSTGRGIWNVLFSTDSQTPMGKIHWIYYVNFWCK